MQPLFPEARDAKRTALLQAVDDVRATITAHADAQRPSEPFQPPVCRR
jgi:hypothetical protein